MITIIKKIMIIIRMMVPMLIIIIIQTQNENTKILTI